MHAALLQDGDVAPLVAVRLDLEAHVYVGAVWPIRGRISVPQGPGLGIEPDAHVIHDHLIRE
jgi:L-alanine-DL-glutamate epimerase-like enolase superfamily enzyme